MGFAEEFGHDIPPDDWNGGNGRRSNKNYFSGTNPLFSTVNRKFLEIVCETDKAYLLLFAEGKAWVPISQVSLNREDLVIYLPFWLFNKLQYIKEE